MKKAVIIILCATICLVLPSCGDKASEETTTDSVLTQSETASESESVSIEPLSAEKYTAEIKDPDFKVPYTFAECEAYIDFPEYDDMKKDGETEKYFSSGVLVYEKTYDSAGRLSEVVVYDSDGETHSVEATYEYVEELSFSLIFYANGEADERYKFTYGDDDKIVSAYYTKPSEGDAMPIIEGYEFNPDGSVSVCLDSDSVSNVLLDAVMSALSQGLSSSEEN